MSVRIRSCVLPCILAWVLLYAVEIRSQQTVFEFTRKLQTCDATDDLALNPQGSTKVLWSYSTHAPETPQGPTHAHTEAGSTSINLFGTAPAPIPLPGDVQTFDVAVNNHTLPTDVDTFYWCQAYKVNYTQKMHMIQYDVMVKPGNEGRVHHVLLYWCDTLTEDDLKFAGNCDGNLPPNLQQCNFMRPIAAWAIGGGVFQAPADVGYPVGPGFAQYFLMQVHYDNPKKLPIVDNSFLRMWLTATPRPHDAGIMFVGRSVDPQSMIIPPGEAAYLVQGYCPRDATNQFTNQNLTVFGTLLHAHMAGRRLFLQHVRNGVELEPLAEEPYYDFNYQETRLVYPYTSIQRGDSLIMNCIYNTQDRTKPTPAGESTREEMCLGYVHYFPLDPNAARCVSDFVRNQWYYAGAGDQYGTFTPGPITSPYVPPNACPNNHTAPAPPPPQMLTAFNPSKYAWSQYLDKDSKYKLYWNFNRTADEVQLAVQVNTSGWLGFGFNPSGQMLGGDVAVAWVDQASKTAHFTDRFVHEIGPPSVDLYQDYYNVAGWSDGTPAPPPPPPPAPGADPLISEYQYHIDLRSTAQDYRIYWTLDNKLTRPHFGTMSAAARAAATADPTVIHFAVRANALTMVALGFGSKAQMIGAVATIGWFGGALQEYNIGAKKSSAITPLPANYLVGTSIIRNESYTIMRWTRNITTPYSELNLESQYVIWAIGSASAISYHDDNKGVAKINLRDGTGILVNVNGLHRVHGYIMSCAFGILFPAAVFSARFLKHNDPTWFNLHRSFVAVAFLVVIAGFSVAIRMTTGDHFDCTHARLGLAVIIAVFWQPVNALVRPQKGEQFRAIWELVHRLSGRFVLIGGIVNMFLGMSLYKCATWVFIVIGVWFGLLSVLALYGEVMTRMRPAVKSLQDEQSSTPIFSRSEDRTQYSNLGSQ